MIFVTDSKKNCGYNFELPIKYVYI